MMHSEDSANLKWNQHPVIATVLWMLGTDLNNSPHSNSHKDSEKQNSNAVGWKDENGGSLSEYLNQIQPPSTRSRSATGSIDVPVQLDQMNLQSFSTEATESIPNPLAHQYHSNTSRPSDPSVENENVIDTNQSPQWGFYVPITPPQQELFVKHEKVTIQSIQADQRKRQ